MAVYFITNNPGKVDPTAVQQTNTSPACIDIQVCPPPPSPERPSNTHTHTHTHTHTVFYLNCSNNVFI